MDVREGIAELPRTPLAWCLSGEARELPTVVFENGWSSSYQQWTLVAPLLSPHTQVLAYDRAGLGASAPGRAASAASIGEDLAALLSFLKIDRPVVVVGQSYGGLMARLHAVTIPQRVCGIVQVDPTPEIDHEVIDQQLTMFRKVGVISVLAARLGLPNPIFAPLWEHFPEREARLLEQRSYRSPESLRAAIHEMDLVREIRGAIAAGRDAATQPRLILSAGATQEAKGWLARRLINRAQLLQTLELMQSLHRTQAAQGVGGTVEVAEAHTHGGLVSTPEGAAYTAARVLSFLRALDKTA